MPRDLVERGKVEVAGLRGGGDAYLPWLPFMGGSPLISSLWEEIFFSRGCRENEGAGALHCTPGPRYTYMTFPSVVAYASAPAARCIPLASVMGIEPIGHWALEARPPARTHTLRFFSGWGIIDPGADGRPLLVWCQRFSGCTPRAVVLFILPASSAGRAVPAALAGTADEPGKDIPNSTTSVTARAASAALASHAFVGDDFHHLPAPSRGKEERNFLTTLPCRSAITTRLFTGSGSAP